MSKMGDAAQACCKFHKTGHCKFGQTCRHFHSHTICSVAYCDKNCQDRHPKPCRYQARFGRCKFGSSCSYLHCDSAPVNDTLANDVEELKKALAQVMQILEAKENQIQKLEDTLRSVIAKDNMSFASDTSPPSPENVRSAVFEDSLNISLQDEKREEAPPAPSARVHCEHTYINGSTGLVVPTYGDPCPLHPCCVMCEITAASEESRPPRFCNFSSDPACLRPCSGAIFNVDTRRYGSDDWKCLNFILGAASLLEYRL